MCRHLQIYDGVEGSILLLILYDAQQSRQSFWAMLMNSIQKEIRFHLRNSVVAFAKRIMKGKGTFIAWELCFQQSLFHLNEIVWLGSSVWGKDWIWVAKAMYITKISCKSLWSDVISPRKAWFTQPSQTVNMQWVQAVLRNPHPMRNTGSAKRGEPEDVISYV